MMVKQSRNKSKPSKFCHIASSPKAKFSTSYPAMCVPRIMINFLNNSYFNKSNFTYAKHKMLALGNVQFISMHDDKNRRLRQREICMNSYMNHFFRIKFLKIE